MTREERIHRLLATLDGPDTNAAEEAQIALIEDFGAAALEPLLAVAPGFSHFGRLCAIEIFDAIGDPRAAPVLIPWLESENDVQREWAADALGSLGATEAIPHIYAAWAATKARGTPPNWSEPDRIRRALSALGARREVLPEAAARLEAEGHDWDHAWPPAVLPEVFGHLADAGQVVMYFQYWRREASDWYGVPDTGASVELDWALPWAALVAESRRQATAKAEAASVPPGTVATIAWLDRSDL
jgi:hypothetical protein